VTAARVDVLLATLLSLLGAECAAPRPAPSPHSRALDIPSPKPDEAPRSVPDPRERQCYEEPWEAADPRRAPKPLSAAEQERIRGLVEGCRDTHPELLPGRFHDPEHIPLPECHYGIARQYFQAQHWIEAARGFRRVAFDDGDAELGIFAAELYLDSLDALAGDGRTPRTACYEMMADDADAIACRYCAKRDNADVCRHLRQVRFEVRWVLEKGAKPSAADPHISCSVDETPVGKSCQPLPPLVPESCRHLGFGPPDENETNVQLAASMTMVVVSSSSLSQ
jgi:hypothetical protein